MRFWKKLTLFIIAVISIVLGCSRYYVVRNNFRHSVAQTCREKMGQLFLERYVLENLIVRTMQDGGEVTKELLMWYLESMGKSLEQSSEYMAFYGEDFQKICSSREGMEELALGSLPEEGANLFAEGTEQYALRTVGERHYMFFTSNWTVNGRKLYLLDVYDVDVIYQERDRQSREILIMDMIVLAVSSLIIAAFSFFLTNPIKKLNRISKKIANGEFRERVRVRSRDEIGELAESFNRMADQVESKICDLELSVKQKDDFINGFSHELKTPMTAIMGYADMLRLKSCSREVTQKALNYIYSESRRLDNLSRKLMTLMSLSRGDIELQPLNVRKLMQRVLKTEADILKNSKVKVKAEPCWIWGDMELLETVLRNLVENADRAQPRDGFVLIRGSVSENGVYRITVEDHGRGIPKEHIERVTEDFYMVDKSRSRAGGGSGIGLSLVKKILELHGAKLRIESRENVGTRVSFELEKAEERM